MSTRPSTLNQNLNHTTSPVQTPLLPRTGSKGLAAMLLAAFVAALVVVADSIVDTYADGHLLTGWIILWAVGFAAIALSADTARKSAARLFRLYGRLAKQHALRRSDAYLRAMAKNDPRLLADIEAAVEHARSLAEKSPATAGKPAAVSAHMAAWAKRQLRARADAALWKTAQRDPRVMAEVIAAIRRAEVARQSMDQALGRAWLARHPLGTFNAGYQGRSNSFRTTPLAGLPTHLQYLQA